MCQRVSDPGTVTYCPRVRRDLVVAMMGCSHRALDPSALANHKSASRAGFSTPCGAVSSLGKFFSVPGLLEL